MPNTLMEDFIVPREGIYEHEGAYVPSRSSEGKWRKLPLFPNKDIAEVKKFKTQKLILYLPIEQEKEILGYVFEFTIINATFCSDNMDPDVRRALSIGAITLTAIVIGGLYLFAVIFGAG